MCDGHAGTDATTLERFSGAWRLRVLALEEFGDRDLNDTGAMRMDFLLLAVVVEAGEKLRGQTKPGEDAVLGGISAAHVVPCESCRVVAFNILWMILAKPVHRARPRCGSWGLHGGGGVY